MREILFRGKRVENDEWVFGDLINEPRGDCIQVMEKDNINTFKLTKYSVHKGTVGQYTGLRDKNGVKIFEGDIVSTDIARPYLIVEFRDGCFMFNCNDGDKDYYDIMLPILKEPQEVYEYGEVIGNIYDHPELVGGAE